MTISVFAQQIYNENNGEINNNIQLPVWKIISFTAISQIVVYFRQVEKKLKRNGYIVQESPEEILVASELHNIT